MLDILLALWDAILGPVAGAVSLSRREEPREDMRILGDINPPPPDS